jgi:hypothetical protein
MGLRAPGGKHPGSFLHCQSNPSLMSFNCQFCSLGAIKRKSKEKERERERERTH